MDQIDRRGGWGSRNFWGSTISIRAAVGGASLAVLAMLAFTAAAASAGTVDIKGHSLEIDSYKGGNHLLINRFSIDSGSQLKTPARWVIEERNRGYGLVPDSPRCSSRRSDRGRAQVVCHVSGIRKVVVGTRSGNDWIGIGRVVPHRDLRGYCRGSGVGARFRIRAGAGSDVVESGKSQDRMIGGRGADLLMGCAGDDHIDGGGFNDMLSGDGGGDTLMGRIGSDDLYGSGYDPDWVYGWEQRGGGHDDLLSGGPGADFLIGSDGKDVYRAGRGSDDLNSWDGRSERVDCESGGGDLVLSKDDESFSGCEVLTKCATDIWPLDPETTFAWCWSYLRHPASRRA